MKSAILLFILFFSSRACGVTEKPVANTPVKINSSSADTSVKDAMHHQQAEYILRNKIQGRWAIEQQPDEPVFQVTLDSIYYIDEDQSYRYRLTADSLFIYYPDWIYSGKLQIDRETMIIQSETGESRFKKLVTTR